MKTFFHGLLAGVLLLTPARAEPDLDKAFDLFARFERIKNNDQANRLIVPIKKALEIPLAFSHVERLPESRILVMVLFSRTHFPRGMPSYGEAQEKVLNLLALADFQGRLYQLNDLHPDQARQTIRQLEREDLILRIEMVPDNAIAITFFSRPNFRPALHTIRQALIPPLFPR